MSSRTVWVDATAGASGDMLLGALLGAGVPLEVVRDAVDAVSPELVALSVEQVTRGSLAATRCRVAAPDSTHHRTWDDVRRLLEAARLDPAVRTLATAAFTRLAEAEAAVHATTPERVRFHEVGALDAIADVVGVAAGFVHLGADRIVVSPVAVGHGWARSAHGSLPVPPPAVVALLAGTPSYAGPPGAAEGELCTPTGAALLRTLATEHGPQPAMSTERVGVGAGTRDPAGHANVVRLLVGVSPSATATPHDPSDPGGPEHVEELVVAANVDDLDPRVWPSVLAALLDAGALDAWLTPVLMKKGRPAHTVQALVAPGLLGAIEEVLFTHTSTIGVRHHPVRKRPLARATSHVDLDGQRIAVKVARLGGRVVNAQPELDDVDRAAAALGRPLGEVLAAAQALAHTLRDAPRPR
ncbi:nickel pincer cofactor biosynthesis protein LarC [Nocardioides sp. dk4132]|uniref:nickel pincer cofactor biosynthesis protein LarC n=1 Tax=unclassified Nocardioides TaxID=2615069 RepID=UPI00129492E6|nr:MULTISPECIES: nickel pincer cofactor biosynthesis protein LarC [unclassified Nocardioides]MQW77151.1 nickel pincer cofactor biosynthesis protein LarC [Nocardioides sp. dk4132]QGA06037.1 nickel pincer cofactor biosynthesis protein LarC [Nocardioides sp. dk884]